MAEPNAGIRDRDLPDEPRVSVVCPTVACMTTSTAAAPLSAGPTPVGGPPPVEASTAADPADAGGADRGAGADPVGADPVVADPVGSADPTGADPARQRRPLALSPSRAGDFKTCPLLYRLRAVDRLPEPPSAAAARGTLVHSVLEQMFGRPAAERTPDLTAAQVLPVWQAMAAEYPPLADLVPDEELSSWLASAESLVRTYFRLEDPRNFDPESCELAIEIDVAGSVPLRGFVDRIDLARTGELRVVDYKTGRPPGPDFEAAALYQLKFYALMLFRLRGVVPTQLKLIYLADGLTLQYTPSETELVRFESAVTALWAAITAALRTGDFPARRSSMCQWCAHQALCPEFGGTPPPYPGPPEIAAGTGPGADAGMPVGAGGDVGAEPPRVVDPAA